MNVRGCVLIAAMAVLTTQPTWAGGGARIIIRQHGGHSGPPLGSGPIGTWLMNEGDMILRSQFGGGGGSTSTANFPPALRAPTPDPVLAGYLNRLDVLNGVTPNNPNTPGSAKFAVPPVDSSKPGGQPNPKASSQDPPSAVPE